MCLKDIDENTIKLMLVHCKGASGGRVSAVIDSSRKDRPWRYSP